MNFIVSTRSFVISFALGSLLLFAVILFLPQIAFWNNLGVTLSIIAVGSTLFLYGGFNLAYRWEEKEAQVSLITICLIEALVISVFINNALIQASAVLTSAILAVILFLINRKFNLEREQIQ